MNYYNLFEDTPSSHGKNALLFSWLCDDVHRSALYAQLRRNGPSVLEVPGCVKALKNGRQVNQPIYLPTRETAIRTVLENSSNSPYRIGDGTFVLALDNGQGHEEQRRFLMALLRTRETPAEFIRMVEDLSLKACQRAMVRPGKLEQFDLVADVAEQAALRFVSALFGIPEKDYRLLQEKMRPIHDAMIAQMFARHFAQVQVTIEMGKAAMGQLAQRIAEVITDLSRIEPNPPGKRQLIEQMVRNPDVNSTVDLATAVVGSIAGIVGNVIACTCISISRYLKLTPEQSENVLKAAHPTQGVSEIDCARNLLPFIKESLRLQPPAPFIPRMTTAAVEINVEGQPPFTIPAGAEVIIPLGAAARDLPDVEQPDEFDQDRTTDTFKYVFGHPANDEKSHRCVGEHIALPLVAQIVRSVLTLPGLATADGADGPKKRWGYICTSYPLQWQRGNRLIQQPLNVVMKIKTPVAMHAEALRQTIRIGAPDIEDLLRGSKIVHFARFVFLNNDTELGLFTVYEGDRRKYLEFFAEAAGSLFDKIFDHIQDPPPMPVGRHKKEFATHIIRYDVAPVEGYFFSAYPQRTLESITRP